MEDQQPGPGDLTDTEATVDPDNASEPAAATTESELPTDTEPVDTGSPSRRTGRLLAIALAVSAALFIGAAAFAGAAVQPYLVDRALVATKTDIVRTATRAITTLWNYTPENMDSLPDRASVYLSGDLEADYRKFIDAIAEPNKQAKITDSTQITGAAVESLDGNEATVIVYTNTTATSELKQSIPSLKYLSYRLSMKRENNRWVVVKMPTITSLNLTPQL